MRLSRSSSSSRNSFNARDSVVEEASSNPEASDAPLPSRASRNSFARSFTMQFKRPSSSRNSSRSLNVAALSDEELRGKVLELFSDMERLRATMRELKAKREAMSNPAFFEVDIHQMFLNGAPFQETLQTLQALQEQQKALLADTARVSALCPREYPELLRLSVDVMTAFSRLAAAPGAEEPPEEIASAFDAERQKALSASI